MELKTNQQKEQYVRSICKIAQEQIKVARLFKEKKISLGDAVCSIIKWQDMTADKSTVTFIEWVANQLVNNKLPEGSSGAFITALGCIDFIAELDEFQDEYWSGMRIYDISNEYNL